jgi:hypothetical protein
MITTNLTGNLGNHMWQYAVCRIVAEKLGYEWGINPSPTHDYHRGMNQMYFMDVDFGKSIETTQNTFNEKWTFYQGNNEHVNVSISDKEIWGISDNTKIFGHNGALGAILQSENYFEGYEENVKNWFKIKENYQEIYNKKMEDLGIKLDKNTCVINFRGGEYRNIPNVVCRREYWRDSINHMLEINPTMKFIVITDDPEFANSYMPFSIPSYHVEIGFDFYVINKSKWVILSNSTFGWWSAWLNNDAQLILAPKYWASHNNSDGYWSVGESYSKKFNYVGRDGIIYHYEDCKQEAINYYKEKNIIHE